MKETRTLMIVAIAAVWGLSGRGLQAQTHGQAFVEGNQLYEKAMYGEALDRYQTALQDGYEAWELYYNMGNTCYRLVDYPRSILYYEKALKLNPKNVDIKNNLALAEGKCLDRFTPLPAFFLYSWWEKACSLFGTAVWGILILIFFALALVSAGVYIRTNGYKSRQAGFYSTLVFGLLFALSMAFGWGHYREDRVPKAVVMQQSVNVKAMPEDRSETKFILHEGSKVRIEDNIGTYYKVRVKNGSRGWIPASSVEAI